MRLYHKYFRQKNPSNRRASLRGAKKELHGSFMKALRTPKGRRKNPEIIKREGLGRSIDAYNYLGKLNQLIAEGHDELIPLRDTVEARIEGYLSEDVLDYSLSEAIRNLSREEVAVLKEMMADIGEMTPEEGKALRAQAKRHASVRAARKRVQAADRAEQAFRTALKRGLLQDTEFLVGPDRLAAMKAQQAGARSELGDDVYRPADMKLWKKVEAKLEQRFPEKFIPLKLDSKRREEFALLVKMRHKDTPRKERQKIKRRLQTALANRWKTALILAYEKAGGRELSRREIKMREAQRMKKLGTPFPLGPGFFGVIKSPKDKGVKGCVWHLFDSDAHIYMSGRAANKAGASREVAVAYRVLANLVDLGDRAGWDNLEEKDRRWLDDKRPRLSKRVARILLQNINERRRVSKSTAQWIVSAADIGKFEDEGKEDVAQTCKNMTTGETRVFPGPKKAYHIHVRKGAGSNFTFFVEMKDGRTSQKRRTKKCSEVLTKAHVVAGAMEGARGVTKAISNPAKIRRLHNEASRYFRKKNPSPTVEREGAELGDIKEVAGMVGIPDDPNDAYRYGFYFGIIRGIDTCGVQNYFKRRKIRNEFQQRVFDAAMETSARVAGVGRGRTGSSKTKKKKKKMSAEEFWGAVDEDIEAEVAAAEG